MIQKLDLVSGLIDSGQIRLGMSRQELQAILGAPDEVGGTSRKYKVDSIFKYGDVQFVFPPARTLAESESQGLRYVYVDEGMEEVGEPIYVLR
jgi:hypothetical protein